MANNAYHLDGYTTLRVEEADSNSETAVAGIQNVTIIPGVEFDKLWTADSIKREEVLQHEFEVDVEIGWSLWDPAFAREWLGGGSSGTSSSMADDTEPQRFNLEFTLDSTQNNSTLGGDTDSDGSDEPVKVTDIVFPEMPVFDSSRGEYAQWDISGTGGDISQVDTA